MKVTVYIYGSLGRHIPGCKPAQGMKVEFPDGSTIADLLAHFELSRDRLGLVSQNGRAAQDHHPLEEGAEIRVYRPVAGG